MTLKKQALLATAGILFLVLGLNTYINIRASTGKYQEALTAKTAILAAGVKKDIDQALGFGMAVNDLTGMVERLQELLQRRCRDIYPFVAAAVIHKEHAVFHDGAGGVHNSRFPIILVPFAWLQNRGRGAIEDFCRVINIKEHGADFVADMLFWLHSVV